MPDRPEPVVRRGAMLEVRGLRAGYGKREIVHGVDLNVPAGAIVALLGHNGAGKSTLLGALIGKVAKMEGSVAFEGRDITQITVAEAVRLGIVMVPEKGRLFRNFSVRKNLQLGAYTITDAKTVQAGFESAIRVFPRIAERLEQKAGTLSGGERQMVAIARAMMMRPKLVLLEEPFLGLAPPMMRVVIDAIHQLNTELGTTFLVVEHNISILTISDQAYVMKLGEFVITEDEPRSLLGDDRLERAYVG
jgi:branched-chain amino acid transport system ATP-binding protein